MLAAGPLVLCLDFDGTLSEIVPHPSDARPVDGVGQVLATLTKDPDRLKVAVISGREIAEVRRMLGVERGILFSGTHGLEIVGMDGIRRLPPGVENAEADLAKARAWMEQNVDAGDGFVIEDKGIAIAMHYRMVSPASAAEKRAALNSFVDAETASLRIMNGKMVDELLPAAIGGKGRAIRVLMEGLQPAPKVIYFGDDTTDEDAFHELRNDGIGVLVGPSRPSWARYRVDDPHQVVKVLAELAQELVSTAKVPIG